MKQWASKVNRFSSQYNNAGWSAEQILGPPKVYPNYGDLQGAWAPASIDSFQFVELEFEKAVIPEAINIYETYNAGGTVAVKGMNQFNQWEVLWSIKAPGNLAESRIFSPPLKDITFATNKIRLDVNCSSAGTWCEIDAVELVGQEKIEFERDDTAYTEAMRSLIDNPTFSDVKLVLIDGIVYAHKSILAARAEFFLRIFENNLTDSVDINLPISRDDLLAMLSFIYTNQLPKDCSTDTLITLCNVSSNVHLTSLKHYAVHQLTTSLTCQNVVEIFLKVQDNNNLADVKEICVKFMASHLKEMANVASFETLPPSVIVKVVQEGTAMLSLSD